MKGNIFVLFVEQPSLRPASIIKARINAASLDDALEVIIGLAVSEDVNCFHKGGGLEVAGKGEGLCPEKEVELPLNG